MKNIEIVISSVINRVLRSFICPTFNGYDGALSMLHTKFTHSPNKDPEKQINKSTSRFQNYKHAHEAVNGKEWKLSWLILCLYLLSSWRAFPWTKGISIPLKRTKSPTSHNQEIWLDTLHFAADYFFGISFLNPCFTSYLEHSNK